jgi:hypothetical protein
MDDYCGGHGAVYPAAFRASLTIPYMKSSWPSILQVLYPQIFNKEESGWTGNFFLFGAVFRQSCKNTSIAPTDGDPARGSPFFAAFRKNRIPACAGTTTKGIAGLFAESPNLQAP